MPNLSKPYGSDWNGDRSATDYDSQRDPWNPASPVFGQWQRKSWFREAVKEPLMWAFAGWCVVTLTIVVLDFLDLISRDTSLIAWIGKYIFLLGALVIGSLWSLGLRIRSTPPAERWSALRSWFKRLPWSLLGLAFAVVYAAFMALMEHILPWEAHVNGAITTVILLALGFAFIAGVWVGERNVLKRQNFQSTG